MITCYIIITRHDKGPPQHHCHLCFWRRYVCILGIDLVDFAGEIKESTLCLCFSTLQTPCVMDTFCGGEGWVLPHREENAAEDSSLFLSKMRQRESACEMWHMIRRSPFDFNSIFRRTSCQSWCGQGPAWTDDQHWKSKTLFKVFIIWKAQIIAECCYIWYQLSLSELIQFIMQPALFHNNPTQYACVPRGLDSEPGLWGVKVHRGSMIWLTLSGVLCVIVEASPAWLYPQQHTASFHHRGCFKTASWRQRKSWPISTNCVC